MSDLTTGPDVDDEEPVLYATGCLPHTLGSTMITLVCEDDNGDTWHVHADHRPGMAILEAVADGLEVPIAIPDWGAFKV